MKPDSVCMKCRAKKYGKPTWKYAQDTMAAKSERAKRRWVEQTERPTIVGLGIGTQTKWGRIEGRGINSQQGRYYVFLKDGVCSQVPAEQVECIDLA